MSQTGNGNGSEIVEEINLDEIPDQQYSKELLWRDAYKHLVSLILEHPRVYYHFFTFYRKYQILGHPRFGRLFTRLGRYLQPESITTDLIEKFDDTGDLIRR